MKKLLLLLLLPLLLLTIYSCGRDGKQEKNIKVSATAQTPQVPDNKRIDQIQTPRQVENIPSSHSWISGITSQVIVVSIFFALLFSILVLLFVTKPLIRDSNNHLKSYVKRRISDVTFTGQNTRKQFFPQELKGLQEEIKRLGDDIKRINERINASESDAETKGTQQGVQQITQQLTTKPETLYLSTPNSDGSFNVSSSSSTFKEGASIYKFIKLGDNRATFRIAEKDASIKLAIQYPDRTIDPVCEAENSFNPNASKIITHNPGEAELQNDKWVVTKKAKIIYE